MVGDCRRFSLHAELLSGVNRDLALALLLKNVRSRYYDEDKSKDKFN